MQRFHAHDRPPGHPASGEVAVDLAWSDQSIWSRMLPRQADVTDEWAGQPQLPAGAGDQPGPTVSGICVAGTGRGPAEGLFEEAEGMLDGETSQIPVP